MLSLVKCWLGAGSVGRWRSLVMSLERAKQLLKSGKSQAIKN